MPLANISFQEGKLTSPATVVTSVATPAELQKVVSWRIVLSNTKKHNEGVFHIRGIFCKMPEGGRGV